MAANDGSRRFPRYTQGYDGGVLFKDFNSVETSGDVVWDNTNKIFSVNGNFVFNGGEFDIGSIRDDIDNLQDDIIQLQTEISNQNLTIDDIENIVINNSNLIDGLAITVNNHTVQISQNETDITNLTSSVTNINNYITTIQNNIDQLQTDSVNTNNNVNNLQNSVTILSDRVDDNVGVEGATVISSRVTKPANSWTLCGGHSPTGSVGLTSNRKWQIDSTTGNISTSAGGITTGATFADYGEYFENYEYGIIPHGRIVKLMNKDSDFLYVGLVDGTDILGVVSATAALRLGGAPFHWGNRYMTTIYGQLIMEEIETLDYDIDGNEIRVRTMTPKENPDYNPDQEYLSREERPEEWTLVGLIGQVFVACTADVSAGMYIKANNGIGIPTDNAGADVSKIRAMKYIGVDGIYHVFKCLILC